MYSLIDGHPMFYADMMCMRYNVSCLFSAMDYLTAEGMCTIMYSVHFVLIYIAMAHACVCIYIVFFINVTGLRLDGRRSNELRRIQCSMGVLTQADGSAKLEQGNTKILATVYGPHDVSIHTYHILFLY